MAEPSLPSGEFVGASHFLAIAAIAAFVFVVLRIAETRLTRRAPSGAPTS